MYLKSLSDKVITIHPSDSLSDNTNKLYNIENTLYFNGIALGDVDVANTWVNANDYITFFNASYLVDQVQSNVYSVYSTDRVLEGNTVFSNGKVGIGTSTPQTALHMVGVGDNSSRLQIDQYNTGDDSPDILVRRASGSLASPAATDTDDRFFRINTQAYDGANWQLVGSLRWDANGVDATPNSIFAVQTRVSNIIEDRITVVADGSVKLSNAFQFPNTDGANNQALITDGSGTVTWRDVAVDTDILYANDYNTYTTVLGVIDTVQDNVASAINDAHANDFNTYGTVSLLIDTVQSNVTALPDSAANDHTTYLTALANDYTTYQTSAANDHTTYLTALANDHVTYLAALANDHTTYLNTSSNDYATYTEVTANLYNTWVTVNTSIDLLDSNSSSSSTDLINGITGANANIYNTYVSVSGLVDTVQANLTSVIGAAPTTLDTLAEIAAALENDANIAVTLTNQIGTVSANTATNATNINLVQSNLSALPDSAANDHVTYLAALSNDHVTYLAASANDYNTYTTVTGLIDTVQSNVSAIDADFIETIRPAETVINVNSATGSVYTFIGDGFPSASGDNPDIYVTRGKTYKINNSSYSSHPLVLRLEDGGTAYTDGVSGAGSAEVIFTVPMNAPSSLVYQCTAHAAMVGNVIVGTGETVDADALVPSANLIGYIGNATFTYSTGSFNDLTVRANLEVQGTITETSSIAFKENVLTLDSQLDKVLSLRPVSYNKIYSSNYEVGLIAEEVAKIIPEVVTEGNTSIQYTRLVPSLIKSIQELHDEVKELKAKLQEKR